ncbi:IS3 family transposase [Salinispora vitiensis]|uniref:IS3 family transposase n=1 Tax=Salinispora vitiensis TaxID=999544 RepID=UPI000A2EF5C2|nr:IS3 family transposase [Salinispora vitiensis]
MSRSTLPDVVRIAHDREPGVTVEQIAKDFGVHPMTLFTWLRQADIDAGTKPGVSGSESVELREARKRIRLLEQENEVLRRAAAYLSQAHLPKGLYPLVSELSADGIPVAVTCRVLNIARQPYYRWRVRRVTDAELAWAYRADALFDAHRDDPEFGYRFLADEARAAGQSMVERTAWKKCSGMGWWSAFSKRKRRGKGGKIGPPVHDDLVCRDFTANGPNRLWLADITEHRTGEGKLYLCAIKDVWSHRIVGYSIDSHMTSRLAVNALHNAVARRGEVAGCVLHTDRGSQFRSRKFVRALHQHHVTGSMGRVGAAGDNAAMESFFGLLQNNVLDRRTWTTRQQLRTAIVTWIERTYHRRRRQRSLSRLTPIEYETIMTRPASQAA